jgi:Uma2 family endonuclease
VPTALKLGPRDRGRPMTFEEYVRSDYETGWHYELIDGRLEVSPGPNFPHDWTTKHVYDTLNAYEEARPDVVNHVSFRARLFVPVEDEERTTAPEPDVAAYADFPLDDVPDVNWRDVSPLIVVEVAGPHSDKDFDRNPDLYLRVPSIAEYWLFDIRVDANDPTLIVHRRTDDGWEVTEYGAADVYRTDLLPGFALPVRPSR